MQMSKQPMISGYVVRTKLDLGLYAFIMHLWRYLLYLESSLLYLENPLIQ